MDKQLLIKQIKIARSMIDEGRMEAASTVLDSVAVQLRSGPNYISDSYFQDSGETQSERFGHPIYKNEVGSR